LAAKKTADCRAMLVSALYRKFKTK